MRGPAVMMVGIAVVVGAATVVGGRFYLAQSNQPAPVALAAPVKPVETTTVVVAAQALRFGMELSQAQLKEVAWPAAAVPPGSAQSIQEFLKGPERRVVIQAMEPNEPVLAPKVTGPGQRAVLSSILAPGMTAVSVTLSETSGVAGLAMPGDRVNVMVTRTAENDGSYTDLLLQNVRLLAVDQIIDQRNEKPLPVRTATLEVMPQDAKRVALAGSVGSISLMLRKAGEQSAGAMGRITSKELFADAAPDENVTASHSRRSTTVKVTRNGKTEDYSVLSDKRN